MHWNIRWRLTLWNTLALAVLLTAFAGLVYALAYRSSLAAIEKKLQECQDQLIRVEQTSSDPAKIQHWIFEFWEHDQIACIIFDHDGKTLFRTQEVLADAFPKWESMGNSGFSTAELPVIGRQYLLSGSLPGEKNRLVVLMSSMAEVDRGMGQLGTVLLMAVPLMLVVSALLAYLLAARALAPMAKLHDATQRISAERLNERLPIPNPHDELGRLTGTINAMIARLERSFAEIRRFTADASHELRTPLAVLRNELEVALRNPPGEPGIPPMLVSMLEECDRLGKLTDQLLTLARQDTGLAPRIREPVPLADTLTQVMETLRPLAEVKNLNFRLEPVPETLTVIGDPARLRQVFINLLDNAIKYTSEGGSVTVEVSPASRGGIDMAEVRIRDTGEGIPPEHLPHVFDRFYRVDRTRSRELGGTGLGLSIARGIVEAHGGTIELDSTPGKGTTVKVALPRTGNPIS